MAGLKFYNHKQVAPATTWTINHNLGHKPVIDVFIDYDGTVQKVLPLNIEHSTDNQTLVTFSAAQTGGARLY